MCFGMVLIMSIYNTALQGVSTPTFGVGAIIQFALTFVVTFIVAFIAESFVEPQARKFAKSLPYDKSKQINFIVVLALCMVPIMVLIMSAYGLMLTAFMTGIEGSIFIAYLKIVGLNVIVALRSQLLIVGPISRRLLTKYVKISTQKPIELDA